MVIDVAHARLQTLKGIAQASEAPLVDSHTNPMAFGYKHPKPTRLRYWAEMELVAKTGHCRDGGASETLSPPILTSRPRGLWRHQPRDMFLISQRMIDMVNDS